MQNIEQIKDYISLDFNQINELIIRCGFILVVFIAVVFIVGYLIDHYKKDFYSVKKYNYRKLNHEIGGGEEYYFRYWIWQRNKKKYLISILRNDLDIERVYSRKALQKRWNKKTLIPFLREVYGNAK
ncbi:hypothetical protein NKE60_05180 [Streptococcus suis]|uniref:hypothetical protein n=1 Tax=Streptococcus suis TaxID=1307 RepID=UPI00209BB7AF|nr:hypothetical protein [Streptococcus suis]MCO8184114.1 hypothetical protein [Streptococcus suis]MCO8215885.1 hypothetical protein [Streptococcus suis]HEM3495774.1 hypothetical protein [Streptococcus suis]HEM3509444.1 hypothetical protein [Streptococcus suis]